MSKVDEVSDDDDEFHISIVGKDSKATRKANKAIVTLLVNKKDKTPIIGVNTSTELELRQL